MQLIIVVGAPRSGTTLLQNLITVHPAITSAPETHFFAHATPALVYERGLPPIGKRRPKDTIDHRRATRLMTRTLSAMNIESPVSDWVPSSSAQRTVSLRELANRLFEKLADGAPYFLEKSPPHVFFLPEIYCLFPHAKIINIVRDPRDVVASINGMLKEQGKRPRSIFERTRIWTASVTCAQRQKLFTVRYEDLVLDQVATMHRVFEHLGLAYDAKYLENSGAAATQTTRERETWKTNNFSAVSSAMIGKFKKRLSTRDVQETETLCRRQMKTLGYERSLPSHPLTGIPLRDAYKYYMMRTRRTCDALASRLAHS